MRNKKLPIEHELERYYYSMKSISRLTTEMERAWQAYNDKLDGLMHGFDYASVKVKGRKNTSPTENAAIILSDVLKNDINRLEGEIGREKRIVERVKDFVQSADLTGLEYNYIRMKYFEMLSTTKLLNKLFISSSSLVRVRKSALEKVACAWESYKAKE